MSGAPVVQPLLPDAGAIVTRIRRVFSCLANSIDRSVGDIELSFGEGFPFLFSQEGDGSRLRVERVAWSDPFGGETDEINREFIEQYGREVALDVSLEDPYRGLLGTRVVASTPIWSDGVVTGAAINFETATLKIEVVYDEVEVTVGSSP